MVVVALCCVDDEGLSVRHSNIVLPKSPYLQPAAAEKLISVRVTSYLMFDVTMWPTAIFDIVFARLFMIFM